MKVLDEMTTFLLEDRDHILLDRTEISELVMYITSINKNTLFLVEYSEKLHKHILKLLEIIEMMGCQDAAIDDIRNLLDES